MKLLAVFDIVAHAACACHCFGQYTAGDMIGGEQRPFPFVVSFGNRRPEELFLNRNTCIGKFAIALGRNRRSAKSAVALNCRQALCGKAGQSLANSSEGTTSEIQSLMSISYAVF